MYYPQQDTDNTKDIQGSNNGFSHSSGPSNFWSGDLGLPQSDISSSKPAQVKPDAPAPTKTSSFQDLLNAGEQKASQLSRRLSEKSESSTDNRYSVNISSIAKDKPTSRSSSTRSGLELITVKFGRVRVDYS